MGLSKEAQNIRVILNLENYSLSTDAARSLEEAQKSPAATSATLTMAAERLEETMRDIMRASGAGELTVRKGWRFFLRRPRLSLDRAPARTILLAETTRLVPVMISNPSQEILNLRWGTQESQGTQVYPGRSARCFVPVMARAGDRRAEIKMRSNLGTARLRFPVDVIPTTPVRFRVLDENGKICAARVYAADREGNRYFPEDATKRLTSMGDAYCHVPGEFTLRLPDRPVSIEFAKGHEYRVKNMEMRISRPEEGAVEIRLERWSNLPSEGWYSVDGHVHMSYGGTLPVEPEDVMLMLEAEDVHVGNMMVANIWGNDVQDKSYFEGKTSVLSRGNRILRWNEEYRNDLLGHLILYNLKNLTDPIYSGFQNSPHPHDDPLNADIADQVLAQGGFVTGAHPSWGKSEHAIDVALGKMGGLEIAGYGAFWPEGFRMLHAFWNCGLPVSATAGTDSFLNVVQGDPLGGARCHVKVDGPLTYESAVAAMEQGRTFVSNGPVLSLTVDGAGPGARLDRDSSEGKVHIKAIATSQWPLEKLVLLYNGEEADVITADSGENRLILEGHVSIPQSGWLAAYCMGPHNRHIFGGAIFKGQIQFAHTSPIWVTVDGKPRSPSADADALVRWVDDFTRLVEEKGKFADDEQRMRMREIFGKARDVFEKQAEAYRRTLEPHIIDARDLPDLR